MQYTCLQSPADGATWVLLSFLDETEILIFVDVIHAFHFSFRKFQDKGLNIMIMNSTSFMQFSKYEIFYKNLVGLDNLIK